MQSPDLPPFFATPPAQPGDPQLQVRDALSLDAAAALTAGSRGRRLHIDGQVCTRRITRADKLILTK